MVLKKRRTALTRAEEDRNELWRLYFSHKAFFSKLIDKLMRNCAQTYTTRIDFQRVKKQIVLTLVRAINTGAREINIPDAPIEFIKNSGSLVDFVKMALYQRKYGQALILLAGLIVWGVIATYHDLFHRRNNISRDHWLQPEHIYGSLWSRLHFHTIPID